MTHCLLFVVSKVPRLVNDEEDSHAPLILPWFLEQLPGVININQSMLLCCDHKSIVFNQSLIIVKQQLAN